MLTVMLPIGSTQAHFEQAKTQILQHGAPTVDVVVWGDCLIALEGEHLIKAAKDLGIMPKFRFFAQDDEIDVTKYDWYDPADFDQEVYTAGEIGGELYAFGKCDYVKFRDDDFDLTEYRNYKYYNSNN